MLVDNLFFTNGKKNVVSEIRHYTIFNLNKGFLPLNSKLLNQRANYILR